jgi:hypothetical protein
MIRVIKLILRRCGRKRKDWKGDNEKVNLATFLFLGVKTIEYFIK